ncbi:MAG TPA: hypothetical protein VJ957_06045 [Longimicrobiales bacterium]|nr:hypothetical protein [Longimicrobiales bacterium]
MRDNQERRADASDPPGGGRERYETLLEVMQQQADAAREGRDLPLPGEKHRSREVLLVILLVAFVTVWWQGETWFGPAPPSPQTTAQLETALRMGMYLQAQRIKAFRMRTGHLPETLEEAGPPTPGVSYQKLDEHTYEITGHNGSATLTYRSDQPLTQLIGDAAARLGL